MFIVAFSFNVEVASGVVTERFEEMQEHLCGEIPHEFTFELCLPYQPGTSAEIDGYLCQTVVHRQKETIPLHSLLLA
ncbi:hypothetical protein SDC9_204654 [bioreactor metagenome]|uniref:Uncharacterized protein n=1 Tax=bioreactor metagenome TaxID=1076179 RepID=A0A645J1B5_9ZZZZ